MNKKLVLILLLVVVGMVSALHANVYVTVKNVWYEGDWADRNVILTVRHSNNSVAYSTTMVNDLDGTLNTTFVLSQGFYSFKAQQYDRSATVEKTVSSTGDVYVVITLPDPWEIHNPPQND
jgi:hypothetical protein